jgi:hypothetical protein
MTLRRLSLLLLPLLLAGCAAEERTIAEQFSGPWQEYAKPDLVQLLISKDATGCGEFYWKAKDGKVDEFAEYLVYCTRDGVEWTAWMLWPGSGGASGPTGISDGPPPPY